MPVVNALLVRWVGGYLHFTNPPSITDHGWIEGFLQVGAVANLDEVTRIVTAFLALHADPSVATSMGIEPSTGTDEPYVDYGIGDTILAPDETGASAAQRVVSLTVVEDENGEITVAPELNDTFMVQEEAFAKQLKSLLNGSMKGASQSASPVPPPTVTNA